MKKIAVLNDLSGLGKCSLTAAIPVISVMGIQACPLPTAVLSCQTGFPSYFCDDYTERMDKFMDEWKKLDFQPDGIYTGFLADAAQADKVVSFIEQFGGENVKILVDPVMGDDGEEYSIYTEALCEKMRFLAKRAAVITPNLTEALLLLHGRERAHKIWSKLSNLAEKELKGFVEETGNKLAMEIRSAGERKSDLCRRFCSMGNCTESRGQVLRNGRSVCVGFKCRNGERNGYSRICPKSSKFSCERDTRCG